MGERFHERCIARDDYQVLNSALIEDPRIAFCLRKYVVMHNELYVRSPKLGGQQMRPEVPINKIAELTLLFAEGSV